MVLIHSAVRTITKPFAQFLYLIIPQNDENLVCFIFHQKIESLLPKSPPNPIGHPVSVSSQLLIESVFHQLIKLDS